MANTKHVGALAASGIVAMWWVVLMILWWWLVGPATEGCLSTKTRIAYSGSDG